MKPLFFFFAIWNFQSPFMLIAWKRFLCFLRFKRRKNVKMRNDTIFTYIKLFKLINWDNITDFFCVIKFISAHCPSHVAIQRQQADGKIWTKFIQITTETLKITDDIPDSTATGDENVCNTAEMINRMTFSARRAGYTWSQRYKERDRRENRKVREVTFNSVWV